MVDAALIQACAPNVAVETVQAVIRVESDGDALALASNRPGGAVRLHPQDLAEAVNLALQEIHAGYSVDVGLMQVNSKNLRRFNFTIAQAFAPCNNIRAGAAILSDAYHGATNKHGEGQPALRAALSAYNTGDFAAGFTNGYVARYYQQMQSNASSSAADLYSADPTVYFRNPQEGVMANTSKPITVRDTNAFLTKGVQVEHDAQSAEAMGAIEDHALSESDAWESQGDPSELDDKARGEKHGE